MWEICSWLSENWNFLPRLLLRATARTAKRVLAIVIPSVCQSVTTRYRFKPRRDRDSGILPHDSLEFLVSYEQTWCRWVRRLLEREHQRGVPPKIVILPILTRLAWERLQIDTDLLAIITSAADDHSGGTNINDLERPWTPKIGVFSDLFAISGCDTHFKSELRRNHSR